MSVCAERPSEWTSRNVGRRQRLTAAWSEFLSRVPWELFVTLTFDPQRVHPVGRELASREAFWWCCETARLYRQPVAWVYAPERSPTGLWHAHALLANAPSRVPVSCGIWKTRNGFIDVRPITDVEGITLYTSKQAALTGEIVWSDTCGRYRLLPPRRAIGLHPAGGNNGR